MSIGKLKPLLLIICASGALTYLFMQTRVADTEIHHKAILEIQRLSYQNSLVNESIMELKADVYSNYDPLTKQKREIRKIFEQIKNPASGLYGHHGDEIDSAIDDAQDQFKKKLLYVEQFKSHNGILKNSLYYLPTAIQNKLRQRENRRYFADINNLLKYILLYSSRPDNQNKSQANLYIQKIRIANGPGLEELVLHAETIIKKRTKLEGIVGDLFAVPTKPSLENVFELYSENYANKVKKVSRYRIAMYALGLLLVTYMFQLFLTLRRTMQDLEDSLSEVAFQKNALDESAIVASVDADCVVNYVNDKFCQISQYSKQELISQSTCILNSDNHSVEYIDEIWAQLANGVTWKGELKKQRKDGSNYWVDATIVPFLDKNANPIRHVALLTDITDRKLAEEKNYRLARYDALTDLPNRAFYLESIENALPKAIESGTKIAILFLDLDNFKKINDTMGHAAGDELLKIIATHLSLSVSESDIVSRLGGDEFTVGLFGIESLQEVETVVEKIMSITKVPVVIDQKEVTISSSIGVSVFPDHADHVSSLLKTADTAMYQAKANGKNKCVYFTEELAQVDQYRKAG